MEILGLLVGFFFLASFFLPWINRSRIKDMQEDLASLRQDVETLQNRLDFPQAIVPHPQPPPAEVPEKAQASVPAASAPQKAPEVKIFAQEPFYLQTDQKSAARKQQKSGQSRFELDLGARLPVWLGAISLICAVFFLVKYSMESGWLGPLPRIGLGMAFGAFLVAAGQWMAKHTGIANHKRLAQGLAGAGLVSLYGSLYAAVDLYHLLPPVAGFIGMMAVTAVAVLLSLRHGQPIAAFGLLGGLLTPVMVGASEPDAAALFTYLFLLFAGMLVIMARRGWWLLALVALAGMYSWTALWCITAFSAADTLALILFSVAVCGTVLALTRNYMLTENGARKASKSVHGLNISAVAGSALTILWLGFHVSLSLFDWSMLGALSLGCMALAYFNPAIYQRVLWAKLAGDFLLFYMWAHGAPASDIYGVLGGMAVLYVALPYAISRTVRDPRFWAALQFVAGVTLYALAYDRLVLTAHHTDTMGWSIAALAAAALSAWQAKNMRRQYQADAVIQDHLVAIYSLAATSFLSLGFAVELPWDYFPLAIAGEVTCVLWLQARTGIGFLKTIALLLCGIFAALHYEQLYLFATLALDGMFQDLPPRTFAHELMLKDAVLSLVPPALFLGAALLIHRRSADADDRLSHVLLGSVLTLALGAAYYAIRGVFQADPDFFAIRAGFLERGLFTLTIAGSGIAILSLSPRTSFISPWGEGLLHLAMLRLFWFDLLLFNPYFDGTQIVGTWPLLNGVTMTYGIGLLLTAWAIYSRPWKGNDPSLQNAYKCLGFALLFAFSSLTVRQHFHGASLEGGTMSPAEFYSYSVVWLLTGLGLLAFGLARRNRTARTASLAFMLLAVGKVFLFDASQLQGLYRVFSFLGLGVSLMGLSYFYSRFSIPRDDENKEDKGLGWF